MKAVSFIAAIALLTAALPVQAQQRPYREGAAPAAAPKAVGDAKIRIYRVSGVRDNGGGNGGGVATSFHCTSFSDVDETIQFSVRNFNGNQVASKSATIERLQTFTASTHDTNLFAEDMFLSKGVVIAQGTADILATTNNIHCSAMIVSASDPQPFGINLHLVRFNPVAGSQE